MIESIFPTPIFRKTLATSTLTSMREFVKNTRLPPSANLSNSTKGGFQSDEKLLSNLAPEISLLKKEIFSCVSEFFPDFYIAQTREKYIGQGVSFDLWGWLTQFGEGGFNSPHIHPRSTISGVYYVQTPEQILKNVDKDFAGWLGFLDPRINSQIWPLRNHVNYYFIPPEPGSVVLFPSYLQHFVPPFRGGGDRTAIAFNLRHK